MEIATYEPRKGVHGIVIDIFPGSILICECYDKGGPFHSHPESELFYALKGKGKITTSGEPVEICKGQSIYIPSNEPHGFKDVEGLELLVIINPEEKGYQTIDSL
jgi:mannose-6-phosphate isomerase-like protein (cupin superfamily)